MEHRRRWIWISALLAIVTVGLAAWALTLRSDRDDTQEQLDGTKKELDTTKQQLATAQQDIEDLESSQRRRTALAVVGGKVLYDRFAAQVGATHDELAETQQEVEDANQAAARAEQEAADAARDVADADAEADKVKAQADQAQAETQAAQSKAEAAKSCARAYIEAFGGLFEGDDPRAQAESLRKDLQSVTAGCKETLADAQDK